MPPTIASSVFSNFTELSHADMTAVIQQSYDGILVTDNNAMVVMVNDAYFRITGLNKADVVGKNFREIAKTLPEKKRFACMDVLETKKPVTYTHPDLVENRIVMVTSSPIFDELGNIRLVITNCRDMTEMVQLREKLEKAQEMEELYYKHLDDLNQADTGPVAVNTIMKELFDSAQKVSSVDVTVLITGESGVGKEVVARYIHDNSPRKDAPFVAVNCGAIPEQLLESEFFGYVGGAFTGASKAGKKGLFETANGGTLLLDEIGDLPFNLQVKLLRALDNREITRVGSNTSTPINVRILAATNQDLADMVHTHKFREDLYYRLNVVNLHIPPLRERPEDIRPLCMHFLMECNQRFGQNKRLNADVLRHLEKYEWPGNIRQLKHAIERMVVLSKGDYLDIATLPCAAIHEQLTDNNCEAVTVNRFIPIPEAIEQVEKQILSHAMKDHASSRQIARDTGIDQTTVLRKIKKYGLNLV